MRSTLAREEAVVETGQVDLHVKLRAGQLHPARRHLIWVGAVTLASSVLVSGFLVAGSGTAASEKMVLKSGRPADAAPGAKVVDFCLCISHLLKFCVGAARTLNEAKWT